MNKKESELRSHRCCFTGHRPQYLKRPQEEIQADLEKAIYRAIQEGYTTFITGMARGVDIMAGEIVYRLKDRFPQLKLIAAVPFAGFEDLWGPYWKVRYKMLLERADYVKYISSGYSMDVFEVRNHWMVDKSAKVIAVFNGRRSGTMFTIKYAQKKNVPVEYLAG